MKWKLVLQYLTLGVIVGPLPFIIANGQAEDANPVMADFNWILSQVNANAAAAGSLATLTAAVAALQPTSGNYVPTWTTTGVAPAIVDGSITGRWTKSGNRVQAVINVLFGAGTTFGTNAWNFSLPNAYVGTPFTVGSAYYVLAAGQPNVVGFSRVLISAPSSVTVLYANGTLSSATGAWGNGGSVNITIEYEVTP